MAVAGGTASSVQLRLVDGRLVEGAVMHRPRDLMFHDAGQCLDVLTMAGSRSVYLALQGFLLPELRSILTPGPLTPGVVIRLLGFILTGYTTQ